MEPEVQRETRETLGPLEPAVVQGEQPVTESLEEMAAAVRYRPVNLVPEAVEAEPTETRLLPDSSTDPEEAEGVDLQERQQPEKTEVTEGE